MDFLPLRKRSSKGVRSVWRRRLRGRSWRAMKPRGRRKCLCCKKLFVPDPRNRRHQRHCGEAPCQKTRTTAAVRRWRGRPENREYWHGEENAARARAWQKANPGSSKRRTKRPLVLQNVCVQQASGNQGDKAEVLQNVWRTQPPLLLGLIAKITGAVLQNDIAQITGQLIASGRALVGPNP